MKINNKWKEALNKKNAKRMHKVFESLDLIQLEEFKDYINKIIEKKSSTPKDYK